jgi:hypothetical protein
MSWLSDHWFQIATAIPLWVIAINTLANDWNTSLIVKRLDAAIHILARISQQLSER